MFDRLGEIDMVGIVEVDVVVVVVVEVDGDGVVDLGGRRDQTILVSIATTPSRSWIPRS